MIRVPHRPLRTATAAVLALGLLGAACGSTGSSAKGKVEESTTTTTIAKGPETTAAQVRSKLTGLLGEHVYLASAATGAALGARVEESAAAAKALDGNTDALTANMTAIFGAAAGKSFDALWKKHIGFLVSYAQGLASHDGGKSAQAMNDLTQYAKDFGAFINSALPELPADAVTGLVTTHIQTLKAVIDGQAAGNEAATYTALQAAVAHMGMIASGLSGAIAKAQPDKIGGNPASKAAELLASLNAALRDHAFLALAATNAALGGRTDEYTAAAAALDANTTTLTNIISTVYGADAGKAFGPLWRKHIGFLVDYTNAVAAKDQAKADAAIQNLLQYADDFGAFLSQASPKLTKEAVATLITTHVSTLKDVIDAQGAKEWAKAFTGERTAADHMTMTANLLTTTIVAQFPEKF